MRHLLDIARDIWPAIIGSASTGLCRLLDGMNLVVGILVGLVTFVYLILRVRREMRR